MMEFFGMNGYGKEVWPCYAVTFAVVLLNIYWARRSLARAKSDARRRLAMADVKS